VGFTIGKLAETGDVFTAIQVEIMKRLEALWRDGVEVFDASKQEYFTCKTMVTCTRHDSPAFAKVRN
jgi:hypothetical protein